MNFRLDLYNCNSVWYYGPICLFLQVVDWLTIESLAILISDRPMCLSKVFQSHGSVFIVFEARTTLS